MSTLGTIRSIGNLRELEGTEGNLKEPCRPMYNYWEPCRTGRNVVKNHFGKGLPNKKKKRKMSYSSSEYLCP